MNIIWLVDIFLIENVFLYEEINGYIKKMIKKVWYIKSLSMNIGIYNCCFINELN